MKTLFAFISCIAFACLLSTNATAQTEITLQDADYEFSIKLPAQEVSTAAAQPVPLNDPIILKRNGTCYAIGCQESPGCEKCTLLWKDQNGNGKINPKKELRCRCNNDPEKECKVRAREVECQE